jgi:predicted small metal-binding protein
MAKVFKCRYKGLDCDFAVRGNTDEEVIERTYPHAQTTHDCPYSLEEFSEHMKDDIREERPSWLPWARRETSA